MLVGAACLLSVGGRLSAGAGLAVVLAVLVPYVALLGAHRRILGRLTLPTSWSTWLTAAIVEEESELEEAIHPRRGTNGDALTAGAALVVVVVASVAMERGATSLGVHFGVPQIIVGCSRPGRRHQSSQRGICGLPGTAGTRCSHAEYRAQLELAQRNRSGS